MMPLKKPIQTRVMQDPKLVKITSPTLKLCRSNLLCKILNKSGTMKSSIFSAKNKHQVLTSTLSLKWAKTLIQRLLYPRLHHHSL